MNQGALGFPARPGPDGAVLTADSTKVDGQTWTVPQIASNGTISGAWYTYYVGYVGALAYNTFTANLLYAFPVFLSAGTVITQFGVNVSTTNASEVARVGLYSDTGTRYPSALLAEASIALSSSGVRTASLGSPLTITTAGVYWLAIVKQGPTNLATTVNYSNVSPTIGMPVASADLFNRGQCFTQASVSGALPNPFTSTVTVLTATVIPAIAYKVA